MLKKILVTAALTLGTTMVRAQDTGWYGGIDLGASRVSGLDISIDRSDTAWGFGLGYRVNRNFAVEGAYTDLGRFKYSTDTFDGYWRAKGISLAAVGLLPLQSTWSLYGKAGVARFFDHVEAILREEWGVAEVVRRTKGNYSAPAETELMEEAAERLDYETAARIRDRIAALAQIQGHQGINPQTVEEADVFACVQEGGQTCIEVFFFRTGQNWGNRAYFPRADRSLEPAEVLGAFLAQFYEDKPAPRQILLSHAIEERELLELALTERTGRRVVVVVC